MTAGGIDAMHMLTRMSDDIPYQYILTVNGCPIRVSKREFERVRQYGDRRTRLESDWRNYLDWLVGYRLKHPHKARAKRGGAR